MSYCLKCFRSAEVCFEDLEEVIISECMDELGLSLSSDASLAKTSEPTQICLQQCLECCTLLESEPRFTAGDASASAATKVAASDITLKKWQIALNIAQQCSTMQGNDVISKCHAALRTHTGNLIRWAKHGKQLVHKLSHALCPTGIVGSSNDMRSAAELVLGSVHSMIDKASGRRIHPSEMDPAVVVSSCTSCA